MSPLPEIGSGVLEQRVLEKDLVVRAEVMNVEFSAVETEAIRSDLKDLAYLYENHRYTLLGLVDLRVREYLKGQGSDHITAIVESQLGFDSLEAKDCARRKLDSQVGELFDSTEGIALLEPTSDPDFYRMGLAYDNFDWQDRDDGTWPSAFRHRTWLSQWDGRFYNWDPEGWISLAEVRRRVSRVLEEYNRSSDERWQSCVFDKYFDKGRDPWAYNGFRFSYENYRDRTVIFNGEDVPVPAGTAIWISTGSSDGSFQRSMSMVGEDVHLFEAAYHSEYQFTSNDWKGTDGDEGANYETIWYKPRDGRGNQGQVRAAALVVTTLEDLEEGEYTFYFKEHSKPYGLDPIDCGQEDIGPRLFRVIVDRDRETMPPAPSNVHVVRYQDGWMISWDPAEGVDFYRISVYRSDGILSSLLSTHTEDPQHYIALSDARARGNVLRVEVQPLGDGTIYVRDFGDSSEPVELRAEPHLP